ncbi:MAG: PAS domain-containing sensor histidine kinase [Candidatus Saganbacteria bacterium]|nr:PAS domain-containing sensor histidine kinase [Candidatus Saganbacteria bacterium]
MKLEAKDLEKIKEIAVECQAAAEVPFFLFAFKKEDTPQFEIKFVHPAHYDKICKDLFLFSVNPLMEKVYQTQKPEQSTNVLQGLKNLMDRMDIEGAVKEFAAKTIGVIPLVLEQDVAGFALFLSAQTSDRHLRLVNAFIAQMKFYLMSRAGQRQARDANSRARMFLEASPFAFFTIDTQGNHVYVSPGIEQLSGYSADEFLRGLVKPEKYIHEEDLQKFMKFYSEALSGQKGEVDFRLIRKDGNIIWVALYSKPLYDVEGKLVGVQAIERDITERKKAEMELETNIEKDQLRTEFMSLISHELRTPVTPIQGYTDMLVSEKVGPLNAQQKDCLHVIKSNSKRLLDLIDSVLDISRVEYGKPIEVKKEPVSLNGIISEVIDSVKFMYDQKQVKLELDLSPEIETIMADEAKLSRVIVNLAGNALKFTPKKGKVFIRTSKIGDDLQFEIEDSGIGIDKENLSKIFEKFYQVDSSYTREAGGIGMGLTIIKEIIEAHGGKVWAESEGLGKGSRFIFTIPLE